jgi:hypothetical protein
MKVTIIQLYFIRDKRVDDCQEKNIEKIRQIRAKTARGKEEICPRS